MKIFIDDGSTAIKMAWQENGEQRTLRSPNSFKPEWSTPFGDQLPANYLLDGERYSFDPISPDAIRTTHTRYQYSDVNVIAIHHALLKTGLSPQPVDVEVTLPLGEYLDEHNQPNRDNIQRKQRNILRPVMLNGGEIFTIRNVRVMPESIPAGFDIVKDLDELDSLLIVDLGGTTLDVAQVRGQFTGITKTFCDPGIGVSLMTEAVKSALAAANTRASSYFADDLILHRHDVPYLRTRVNDAAQFDQVLNALQEKEAMLNRRVQLAIERFSGYTHVAVVGGGANIVEAAVRKVTAVPDARFFESLAPQFDLVNGLYQMGTPQ
ncbi:plasmid segregation protein ParM [Serratia sp. BIGb0163]|uniref:plasmid segregation protein ParM n=1 Tax=Serratia sp. BIGb0163 TaxID=2940613 RepID=UPI00216AA129|nr:plasmid segregation protein ParM [Serratia sp. BIGb0163]MCS4266618.1 plasmid segregation protein ParM [Serratia sp. BIGb0163]